MKEQLIKKLKDSEIVLPGEFILRSGKVSDFYIDIKKAYGDPLTLRMIGESIFELFDVGVTGVAVMGHGGIPLGTVISVDNNLKLTIVREKPKPYGLSKWIDGHLPLRGERFALVDDVYTTGSGLIKMRELVSEQGASITGSYVVVLRAAEKPENLKYLFRPEDLR